ncbi:MAG: hypothetical protein ACP5RO_01425 [Fervidicoccaceae archaeon]
MKEGSAGIKVEPSAAALSLFSIAISYFYALIVSIYIWALR